jgi:6-pyruvoyltetrahydropterin/6-carboxytetrahydropterin synthase
MYEIRVSADFCAAHFLKDYHGKCENLHGHNYKVYAHVRGSDLDDGGMLLDFSELKKSLRRVCDALDHTNLNDEKFFEQNPSAEKIAFFIYQKIISDLPALKKIDEKKTHLYAVDVFETEGSRARFLSE